MQAESANADIWINNDKIVIFVPMSHVGRSSFYEDVKNIIADAKKDSFIIYYEGAQMGDCTYSIIQQLKEKNYVKKFYKGVADPDSICMDTYKRKMRRLTGIGIDSTGYARYLHEKGIFKNLVDQPKPEALGITNSDMRVDITQIELVNIYEKLYGEISLYQLDYAISLNDIYNYPRGHTLPKKQVGSVIIDFRNKYLAEYILQSPDKKIVVIYGAAHKKGVFRELKEKDSSWRSKKIK